MKNPQDRTPEAAERPAIVHYPWLDWLRFGSAFIVLLAHARGSCFVEYGALDPTSRTKITMLWYALTRVGHESVMVFFVMSGYLVGGRLIERVAKNSFDWRSYSIDRASRILMPMVPAILFTVVAEVYLGIPVRATEVVGNLLCLQGVMVPTLSNNLPLWSLAYEVWFYILAGALAVVVMSRPSPARIAMTMLFVSLAIFTELSTVYLFCWAFGAMAYCYPSRGFSWSEAAIGSTMIFLGLVMYQISMASRSITLPHWAYLLGSESVAALILSLGIAIMIRNLCHTMERPGSASILGKVGGKFAAFSYSLYLIHYPVLGVMQNLGFKLQTSTSPRNLGLFAANIAICLVVSVIYYWVFERNTPTLRRLLRTWFLH